MVRMAAIFASRARRAPRTIRLALQTIYVLVASLMAFVGVACTVLAAAAGVTSLDVLAMVFFMGAAATLLMLIVWYLLQLRAS
jgi:hypothetical protein